MVLCFGWSSKSFAGKQSKRQGLLWDIVYAWGEPLLVGIILKPAASHRIISYDLSSPSMTRPVTRRRRT
jgi:hypothetical protein